MQSLVSISQFAPAPAPAPSPALAPAPAPAPAPEEKKFEKAIEVMNEIKLNVDEHQDDIKHLKEQCDRDNKDYVQEITAV